MQREILGNFHFIPFTGIGYVAVFYDRLKSPSGDVFKFCFPLMLETWHSETNIPEKYIVLEPQAKFEVSFRREKWIETYYYMNFVFKKEYETTYDKWRKRFISEVKLYFLEQYDEIEVPVCLITQLNSEDEDEEKTYCLLHNFYENFYAFPLNRGEEIFVLPKRCCEQELLDIIQRVVSLEIHELLKKKTGKGLYPNLRDVRKYKVLYLNKEFQKVYNNELNKAKEMFGLNKEV